MIPLEEKKIGVLDCNGRTYKAIVAIHNTKRGPSLGGCRMKAYASEEDAVFDVSKLAEGMTYKAAAAGLPLGGGKAVIMCDPEELNEDDRKELFASFGKFVDELNKEKPKYITAEDVGTCVKDMEIVAQHTEFVTGIKSQQGSGDPSPLTAFGVFRSMQACCERKNLDLKEMTVCIQGVGHVGYFLIFGFPEEFGELASRFKGLINECKKILITDINQDKINQILEKLSDEEKVEVVDPDKIFDQKMEIFSPSALGGIINKESLTKMHDNGCKIICGAANNQIARNEDGSYGEGFGKDSSLFRDYDIIYSPDYIANAGGLINVSFELLGRRSGKGYDCNAAVEKVSLIYDTTLKIIERAHDKDIPTYEAADEYVEEILSEGD